MATKKLAPLPKRGTPEYDLFVAGRLPGQQRRIDVPISDAALSRFADRIRALRAS